MDHLSTESRGRVLLYTGNVPFAKHSNKQLSSMQNLISYFGFFSLNCQNCIFFSQDTIIALQSLAEFATMVFSPNFNMRVRLTSKTPEVPFQQEFVIDQNNALVLQTADVCMTWTNLRNQFCAFKILVIIKLACSNCFNKFTKISIFETMIS